MNARGDQRDSGIASELHQRSSPEPHLPLIQARRSHSG